jgi:hypothetical protein
MQRSTTHSGIHAGAHSGAQSGTYSGIRAGTHSGTYAGTLFGILSRIHARIYAATHAALHSITQPDGFASTLDLLWPNEAPAAHSRLRMVAWSLSLSSILWCALIFAGRELWKVWR